MYGIRKGCYTFLSLHEVADYLFKPDGVFGFNYILSGEVT
jgi:hypothetical protein